MKTMEMQKLEALKTRSAWGRGVKTYAIDLLQDLENGIADGYFSKANISDRQLVHEFLLNGAKDWKQYSWGGHTLICDSDIADTLCNLTELKRTKWGRRRPNKQEEWLDVQARALYQAEQLVMQILFTD